MRTRIWTAQKGHVLYRPIRRYLPWVSVRQSSTVSDTNDVTRLFINGYKCYIDISLSVRLTICNLLYMLNSLILSCSMYETLVKRNFCLYIEIKLSRDWGHTIGFFVLKIVWLRRVIKISLVKWTSIATSRLNVVNASTFNYSVSVLH